MVCVLKVLKFYGKKITSYMLINFLGVDTLLRSSQPSIHSTNTHSSTLLTPKTDLQIFVRVNSEHTFAFVYYSVLLLCCCCCCTLHCTLYCITLRLRLRLLSTIVLICGELNESICKCICMCCVLGICCCFFLVYLFNNLIPRDLICDF